MLKIGEFSKTTGVTIKALRHYESLGLIKPYWIDKYTGYRYYDHSQVIQVNRILYLKSMGFALQQVRQLLSQDLSLEKQRQLFENKRKELLKQIEADQLRLVNLDHHLVHAFDNPQTYLIQKEKQMELELKSLPAFKVYGLLYVGKNENQEISALWDQFNQRGEELCPSTTDQAFGVCRMIPTNTTGEFEYLAGVEYKEGQPLPQGTVVREVPACTVAVFKHVGAVDTLHQTYVRIYSEWLPSSNYEPLEPGFDMEVYNEEFTFFAPDSVMYIYVPVKQKA